MARGPRRADESYVFNFTYDLLRLLGYEFGPNSLLHQVAIGNYRTRGKGQINARAHVALLSLVDDDGDAPFFFVQCKTRSSKVNLEPQIFAQAVAVFQVLQQANPDIEGIQLPCITMRGSFPTFYKIPVTKVLCNAVRRGKKPAEDTIISRYIPLPQHRRDAGMNRLTSRQKLVQDLLAFLPFIKYPHAQLQAQEREEDGKEEEI